MGRQKLTDAEIDKRMQELRNLRALHAQDQKTKKELRARVAKLELENQELKQVIATQSIQIAELQTMVFGEKILST